MGGPYADAEVLGDLLPQCGGYLVLTDVRVNKERLVVIVTEDVDELNLITVIYELDHKLNVLSAVPSVHLQAAHRELEKTGIWTMHSWPKM